jgi:hypothetical protein
MCAPMCEGRDGGDAEEERSMMEGTFHSELLDDGSNGHAASGSDDNLNRFLEDALGSVLRSARESAADLMERAKRSAEQQVEDTRRLWEDAQREVDRMTAWRALVEPLVETANEKVRLIQRAVAEVPGRVADALSPVNDALTEMDQVMDALTHALQPPAGSSNGPNGGSRPFGALDDVPAVEPVGERVDVVDEFHDARAGEPIAQATEGADDAQEPAAQATESTDDGASSRDEPATADIPVAQEAPAGYEAVPDGASAEVAGMTIHPSEPDALAEEPQESEEHGSSETSPTWVTWPATDAVGVGSETPADDADHASNAPASVQPDEDDAALRSTTSQLRRAVTDIDWNDLPSASSA